MRYSTRAPSTSLGQLDNLRLEICSDSGKYLRARELVRGIHIYQIITMHALEALCIILRTNIAPWHTLRDLFNVVTLVFFSSFHQL